MKKTRSMKGEMDERVFVSRHSWHFSFVSKLNKVYFPIYTLNRRVNNYVSRKGKGVIKKKRNYYCYYLINCSRSGMDSNFPALTVCYS